MFPPKKRNDGLGGYFYLLAECCGSDFKRNYPANERSSQGNKPLFINSTLKEPHPLRPWKIYCTILPKRLMHLCERSVKLFPFLFHISERSNVMPWDFDHMGKIYSERSDASMKNDLISVRMWGRKKVTGRTTRRLMMREILLKGCVFPHERKVPA